MLKIQFEDRRKPAIWLVDSTLKLGSDADCDIVINESMVDPVHAELIVNQDEILLKNVSNHRSVFINEVPIVNQQVLCAWDIIRLGSSELEIIDPLKERTVNREKIEQATVVRSAVSPWMLKGVSTPLDGQYFSLANGNIIGREKGADVIVPLSFVSRQHAKIAIRKEKLYIEDLNSSNGSYVNGEKIKRCELRNGDELRFDEFIFSIIGPVTKVDSQPRTVVRDKKTVKKKSSSLSAANPQHKKNNDNKRVFLHGMSADVQGKVYEITNSENHISRMLGHHLSTSEESVSARHVYLTSTDLGWEIKNNGASDGLVINGKMQSRVVLQDGDEIVVGGTRLKFQGLGETPLNYSIKKTNKKSRKGLFFSIILVFFVMLVLYFSEIF